MNIFQRLILPRRKGGWAYLSKKISHDCYALYPDDIFTRNNYHYYQKVYIMTGEITKILGLDAKHLSKRDEWLHQKYDCKELLINDIKLTLDHPALTELIISEYLDIYPNNMYYDKSGYWLNQPNFSQKEFTGEGPYETQEVQLQKDDVVIDCGANIGLFSILAVKRGSKIVYSFDPQERAQNLLKTNIIANNYDGKIIPVPYGLSNKKCTVSFIDNTSSIGACHISWDGELATTTIECTTIDDWVSENNIPHIDFIKADIEGSERDMLNGARNTIKRDHPRLAICTYHLPDDPEVIRDIILSIDPTYHIDQRAKKLYAW